MIPWNPDWVMYILWKSDQVGPGQTCCQLPSGTRSALEMSSLMVYSHHGQFPGISGVKPYNPLYLSGVSMDALLFSQSGVPLVHSYHVFSRAGTHVSLRGNYMIKLWAFTEQADAEGRESRNRDQARSTSSRMDPDIHRSVHRWEPEDLSPRCKSRQALSPCPATSSATTRDSVDVSTPVPRSRLYGRGTSLPPIDLQLLKFADKDFIPDMLQSMWVATQEYPASLPSLASQSVCLDLDAISSGDSEVSTSGAPGVSLVVITDQELTVICTFQ